MRAWHLRKPELLAATRREVRRAYPTLHFFERKEHVWLKGGFPLADDGRIFDRYKVELKLARDYPNGLPTAWEIGGRIPRVPERHVNPQDGSLCTCLPDAQRAAKPEGTTLMDFLDGPLRNYLLGNTLVEMGEPWPFGEWSHGSQGVREFYGELLGTTDSTVIARYLACLGKPILRGHWSCPCGSRKKVRDCHLEALRTLRTQVPAEVARAALASFDG